MLLEASGPLRMIHGASAVGERCRQRSQMTHSHGVTPRRSASVVVAERGHLRFPAREIDTAGDGFLAAFDGPARAVRCGQAIVDLVKTLGIHVRAGDHTGECEIMGQKLRGIAVHIGARVAAMLRPMRS
jgi:class 3 adenylate cyclase